MLIGHNPAIQELTLTLARRGALLDSVRAKFPTAGLATLAIDAQRWAQLRSGDASLLAFVTPAQLAAGVQVAELPEGPPPVEGGGPGVRVPSWPR
jgi:hypothetical protein